MESKNLMQGLLDEIERCVEVKTFYDEIPQGKFGSIMIQQSISKAKESINNGDTVAMIAAYNELKEIE